LPRGGPPGRGRGEHKLELELVEGAGEETREAVKKLAGGNQPNLGTNLGDLLKKSLGK